MWVERLAPFAVDAKSDLPAQLRAECKARGLTEADCEALIALLPAPLTAGRCFLDRLTGLWKYEFGEPYHVGTELVWGHLWTPVAVLFDALVCARLRLPPVKLTAYFARLASDATKHQEHLAEMFPLLRMDPAIPVDHELMGRGEGNRTIDWEIGPHQNRRVLLDVKRRSADFIAHIEAATPAGAEAQPSHDPALLFRSLETKFLAADPDQVLQGAWIQTDIKQEASELAAAFNGLNPNKVHYAVLGDSKPDIHLLTRRDIDRPYLLDLFRCVEGPRFTFERSS